MANNMQQDNQTIRLPLFGVEPPFGAAKTSQAWHWKDQLLVNCFPIVGKDPLTNDSGEVKILSRAGLMNVEQANAAELASALSSGTGINNAEPLAVLGIKGLATNVTVVAYFLYDSTASQYQLRVCAYLPTGGNTAPNVIKIGTVNLTSYNYTGPPTVHLSQITNGAGLVGVAVTFHPQAYATSTAANSDMYYAITVSGAFVLNSLTAIADTDFPTNSGPNKGIVGALVQLNNVHYVMTTDGYIYGSYPSLTSPFNPDITTWNSSGNTPTYQSPDGGAGLIRYKHHLLAFGQHTCEFFNDEGLAQPSLPIRRTQQAFFKVGLLNAQAYTHIDDDLYFIGQSGESNHIGLYRLSGYTPELVSSVAVNNTIQNRSHYYAQLQVFSMYGARHIATNIWHNANPEFFISGAEAPANVSLEGTLIYCIDSKAWWLWAFESTDGSYWAGTHKLLISHTTSGFATNQYVWSVVNGLGSGRQNFSLHPSWNFSYSEISSNFAYDSLREGNTTGPVVTWNYTIPVFLVTNRFDLGTMDRKTINRVRLLCDRPYNITGTEPMTTFTGVGHTLQMRMLKDEDADNTVSNSTGLSASWDVITLINNPTMNWNNLGTCRKFKFLIAVNTWTLWRFEGLELNVTKGVH